jgi:hypothetical protein
MAALLLLGIGLVLHAFRKGRIRMSKIVADLEQADLNRLQEDFRAGRWVRRTSTNCASS